MNNPVVKGHKPPLLAIRSLTKRFGGRAAVEAVGMEIMSGEVRALLGTNGSGKSTLIKILAGYHAPEAGSSVTIAGSALQFGDPASSYDLGCRFIHQDLALIDAMSVEDNLAISGAGYMSSWGTIRSGPTRRRAREDLRRLGLEIDPRTLVSNLTPAEKTGVAVARACHGYASGFVKLVVMDEPTARLPESETERLFGMVRKLAENGVAVLYVSHRLEDVFKIADNVTVMRDGHIVDTLPTANVDHDGLVRLLLGRAVEAPRSSPIPRTKGARPALEIQDLVAPQISGLSLVAYRGEVLGVAGISGSGRDGLLPAVFGAAPRYGGVVKVDGAELRASDPLRSIRHGIAYMPPDRQTHGGVMGITARENLGITGLSDFWSGFSLSRRKEVADSKKWFSRLGVVPQDATEAALEDFSGGNQQKILYGKWFRVDPTVLLIDEPTQGVDVGAKVELHSQLVELARQGASVIVSSSDVEELSVLCDRVVVIAHGRVVRVLDTGEATPTNLSALMLGQKESA